MDTKKCIYCRYCVTDQMDGATICTVKAERVEPEGVCEEYKEAEQR